MITMAHQRSGWSITNNGEMTVSTPFADYRMSKWSWSHENSANKWKCHHELDVNSRQFIVDIDVSHRVTREVQGLSAKIAFQTPANIASWLQNLNAVVDYQHDRHAWKSSGRTNFQWGRYAFGHEHDFDVEPYTTVVTTAKISTPFSGFEQLGIGLNNRRSGNSWRANNEILMGHHGKVTLDGSLNYSGYNFDSMIGITTPIRHLERIVVNVRNAQQNDDVWASHADVQYASDKTVSANSKFSLGSQKMIELEATTPFSFLRQMKYKASYSGTWRTFRASTELQHNMLGPQKIRAIMSVDANNLQRMNGQLIINTPFEDFSSLRVTARHIQDSYEHMTTTLSWQLNQYRGSLLHDVTANSWTDFDSRYELEYLNNRKIELTSSFHVGSKIIATATLRSPCEHARHVSFSFSEEGPLDNFKIISELLYDSNKKITTNMEFALTDNSLHTFFIFTTPFTTIDRFSFEVTLSGSSEYNVDGSSMKFQLHTPWRALRSYNFQHANKPGYSFVGWRNSWTAESNGQRHSGMSECDWNGNQLNAHIVWNATEEYSISISHTGESVNHFSNNIVIKLASDRITEALEFRRTADKIDLLLNIASTFQGYERMEAVFKHELSERGFGATASISTPFPVFPGMSTELSYERSANQLNSQFRARLPFQAVRRLILSLDYRGNLTDFSSNLTTSVNDKTITSTLIFNNKPRLLEGSLNIDTPFDGYNRFRANFAVNGEPQHFTATSTVQLPFDGYERFYAELSHNGNWKNFQTSGKIESSKANLRSVNFNVQNMAISWTQIKTLVSVALPSGTFSAKLIHNGDFSNFSTNLEVTTPLSGYNIFAIAIEQEHLNSMKTSISVQTPIQGYEKFGLKLLKTGDIRNLQLEAELMTSVRKLERTAVNWSHNINRRVIELHGILETSFPPYQNMALTFTHSAARRSVTTNILLETSVPGYSKFSALHEYSSSRRNWKWNGSVEMPVRGYERWTAGLEHALNDSSVGFRTVVEITTPIKNYNNFAAIISHSGEASQFRSHLRLNVPFREVPQIDVTLTHRGASLRDFTSSVSVDYAGKKIELEMALKMGRVQRTEITYEGSFRLVAPCPYVRDFSITVSHSCKPEIKTGALKIIFNGNEKVCTVLQCV